MIRANHFSGAQGYPAISAFPRFSAQQRLSSLPRFGSVQTQDMVDLTAPSESPRNQLSKAWDEVEAYVLEVRDSGSWQFTREQQDEVLRLAEPLIRVIARSISSTLMYMPENDGVRENDARLGLLDALTRWDPSKSDAKLSTYASRRIRGAVWDGVREEYKSAGISRSNIIALKAYDKAYDRLAQSLGQEPTEEQVIEGMVEDGSFSTPEVARASLLRAWTATRLLSWETPLYIKRRPFGTGEVVTVGDTLSTSSGADETILLYDSTTVLLQQLGKLRKRNERNVNIFLLNRLFWSNFPETPLSPEMARICGGETVAEIARALDVPESLIENGASQAAIGEHYGVTESRVCQIVGRVEKELKQVMGLVDN